MGSEVLVTIKMFYIFILFSLFLFLNHSTTNCRTIILHSE